MVSEIVGLAMQREIYLYKRASCGIAPNVGRAFRGHPGFFLVGIGALGSTSFRGRPRFRSGWSEPGTCSKNSTLSVYKDAMLGAMVSIKGSFVPGMRICALDVDTSLPLLDPSSAKQILGNSYINPNLVNLPNNLVLEPEALGIDSCRGAGIQVAELDEAMASIASNTSKKASSIGSSSSKTSGVDLR